MRVIDGDTIRVAIGIWPDEEVTAIRVRGVDTPELKAKCPEERALAQKAKAFTAGFLLAGSIVILRKIKADKSIEAATTPTSRRRTTASLLRR